MNETEQKLLSRRLAEPSGELDRRMAESFSRWRERRPARLSLLNGWSIGGAIAAVAVGGFFISRHSPSVRPPAVVYPVEAQGLLREMLLNPNSANEEPLPLALQLPSS